jgi:hypothetical protein
MSDLEFDPATHVYRADGVEVPSVTQCIPDPPEAAQVDASVWIAKQELGRAVHLAIELDVLGELDESTVVGRVEPYFEAWRQFRDDLGHRLVIHHAERRLWCPTYRYAGQIDLDLSIDGVRFIVDAKATYAKPAPAVDLQLAGYRRLVRQAELLSGCEVPKAMSLWLRPQLARKYELVPMTMQPDVAERQFLAFVSCEHWRRANGYHQGAII